jgi:dsDNA-binding SOS-regulon protein
VIEASGRLLDDLGQFQDEALNHYLAQEKERLAHAVEEERKTDRWTDIERDDRFE